MLQDRQTTKQGGEWHLRNWTSKFLDFKLCVFLLLSYFSVCPYPTNKGNLFLHLYHIFFSLHCEIHYKSNTKSEKKKILISLRISRPDIFTWLLKHGSPYGSQEMGTFLYATVLVNNVVSQKFFKIKKKKMVSNIS